MIELTTKNDNRVIISEAYIESMEAILAVHYKTVIHMNSGHEHQVKETLEEIYDRIAANQSLLEAISYEGTDIKLDEIHPPGT